MHTPETPSLQLFNAPVAADPKTVLLGPDADPRQADLRDADAVELQFPAFNDGRAFSQAFLLRRRLGFTGHIRATGDVLIDQLLQMRRSGFTQAVLRDDQDLAHGERLLTHFEAFYQGDAVQPQPRFASGIGEAIT